MFWGSCCPNYHKAGFWSLKENTLLLLSGGTPDYNKIIKDNAGVWGGKGGGRPNSARVMFPTAEDMDYFLEFIKRRISNKIGGRHKIKGLTL